MNWKSVFDLPLLKMSSPELSLKPMCLPAIEKRLCKISFLITACDRALPANLCSLYWHRQISGQPSRLLTSTQFTAQCETRVLILSLFSAMILEWVQFRCECFFYWTVESLDSLCAVTDVCDFQSVWMATSVIFWLVGCVMFILFYVQISKHSILRADV